MQLQLKFWQALEALALACFIGGDNYEVTEDVMVVLWQMGKHKGNHHSDQVSELFKLQDLLVSGYCKFNLFDLSDFGDQHT